MAYISATDVAAIRTELKQNFPTWKFSVRKGAGSLSVDVTILQGDVAFKGNTNAQVNQYYIKDHWQDANDRKALETINEIIHNAPGRAGGKVYFDESDSMTDYFHTAFYTHLSIGSWKKPYIKA
jgi:hypothetical protein